MPRNWLFDPSIRVRTCIESRIRAESHGNERDSARTSYSPFSCRLYRISLLSRSRNRYARTSDGRGSFRRSTFIEIHTMDERHASTHAATLAGEKWQRRPLGSRVPMRYRQKRNYTAPRGAGPKFASANRDWRSYILLGWRESPWTRVMAHVREPEHAAEI